jgi:membrane fusion protein (multidrug efflux system)
VCAERAFKLAETEARRTTRSAEQLRYQAEFNSAWSDLIQQQAKLSVLEEKGKMQASLARTDAAPLQDLKRTVIRERFYRDSLAQELKGLVALRERSQIAVSTESDTQIAAVYDAKISAIDSDLATIGDRLSRCQVRAPVSGVVVRRYEFVGEAVDETSPVVTLLEDDSLTIDLYLSSKELNRIRENQNANVFISSTGQRCVCQVVNVDPQLQHPPANLQNFFWSGRKLALIRLRPDASAAEGLAKLPLSSTVVMKRTWTSAIRDSEFSSLWATTSSHWSFKTRPATRD